MSEPIQFDAALTEEQCNHITDLHTRENSACNVAQRTALTLLTLSSDQIEAQVRQNPEPFVDTLEMVGNTIQTRQQQIELLEAVQARLLGVFQNLGYVEPDEGDESTGDAES